MEDKILVIATEGLLVDEDGVKTLPVNDRHNGWSGVTLGGCGILADEDGVSCYFPDQYGAARMGIDELCVNVRIAEVRDRMMRAIYNQLINEGVEVWEMEGVDGYFNYFADAAAESRMGKYSEKVNDLLPWGGRKARETVLPGGSATLQDVLALQAVWKLMFEEE